MKSVNEKLSIKNECWNKELGNVRLVQNIGRNPFSVGQIKIDPNIVLKYNGNNCTIIRNKTLLAWATKTDDNL